MKKLAILVGIFLAVLASESEALNGLYLCLPGKEKGFLGLSPAFLKSINPLVQVIKKVFIGICVIWGAIEFGKYLFKKEDKDKHFAHVKNIIIVFAIVIFASVGFDALTKGKLFRKEKVSYKDLRRPNIVFEKCKKGKQGVFVPAPYLRRAR